MDSKNKEDKIWVDKLRLDIQTEDIDEALDNRGLRAEEIRLLPKGRAVLVFAQKSGRNAIAFHATPRPRPRAIMSCRSTYERGGGGGGG